MSFPSIRIFAPGGIDSIVSGAAASVGAGGVPTRSSTELEPGRTIESARLVTMKRPARMVVARDRTLADQIASGASRR